MSRVSLPRAGSMLAALLIVGAAAEQRASAQAWVDTAGSLSASVDYSFSPSDSIVTTPDDKAEDEPITSHMVQLGVEYTPIEDLAVDVALPLVALKYGGDGEPFPSHGEYDDGDLHTTLTDLRTNVRYQLLHEIVAFTPQLGITIPVADYENVGFANAGRGLKQVHLGASVGRVFDPVLPNLFFQAGYEFTLSEKFDDTMTDAEAELTKEIGQNRSDISFLLGYFFLEGDLRIDAGFNWRIHHGGIDFTELGAPGQPMYDYHDPLLKEEIMLVGGDVGYDITDRVSIEATTRFFLRGYNTRDANIFGLGLTFEIL